MDRRAPRSLRIPAEATQIGELNGLLAERVRRSGAAPAACMAAHRMCAASLPGAIPRPAILAPSIANAWPEDERTVLDVEPATPSEGLPLVIPVPTDACDDEEDDRDITALRPVRVISRQDTELEAPSMIVDATALRRSLGVLSRERTHLVDWTLREPAQPISVVSVVVSVALGAATALLVACRFFGVVP